MSRAKSRQALEQIASGDERPEWQRWVSRRLLELGMSKSDLAARLGVGKLAIRDRLKADNEAPTRTTIRNTVGAIRHPQHQPA